MAATSEAMRLHAPTGNTPKSMLELKMMVDAGIVPTPELKVRQRLAAPKYTPSPSKLKGGNNDVVPACFSQRVEFPCGTYEDPAAFEADHGPFSRALGNLEDFELTNGPANSLCVLSGVDANCQAYFDAGFCGANALDAGDILTGIAAREKAPRPAGQFGSLVIGAGFNGIPSKSIGYNYFADTYDVKFPDLTMTCGVADPFPTAVGMDVYQPFGTGPGAEVVITLQDGSKFEWTAPGGAFNGTCCDQPITNVNLQDNNGTALWIDNFKWSKSSGTCVKGLVPLTLEDTRTDMECLADALAGLELKLDTFECGGTGGSTSGAGVTGKLKASLGRTR
jgi:hypothetical protein